MNDKMKDALDDVQKVIADNKARVKHILENEELTDEDGYPTELALEAIEKWHWDDPKGWFEFIHGLWFLSDWGWKECDAIDDITGEKTYCYYIATAGWSGNEAIIGAMQKNHMMWYLQWVQSRRGGHYIFELKEIKE